MLGACPAAAPDARTGGFLAAGARGGASRAASMGSCLLPLLALLGAAGLKASEWEGSPAPEPGTTPKREHPFPGHAEPHPGSSTQSSTASSLLSAPLPSSLAASSADSMVSPAGLPSGPTAMEPSSVLGRTQSPTLDAGRIERTGAPSALGTSLVSRPVSGSIATQFLTLSPELAQLPGSTSLKEVAASGHSEGVPRSGPEGSTPDSWPAVGPSEHRDTWEWLSNQAQRTSTPEPGSKSTAGVALAQSAASSGAFAEDLRSPAVGGREGSWLSRAGSWMSLESETHRTPLAPTWPAARDTTDSAFVGSSTPSETLGPEGGAAAGRTPSHDRSGSSPVTGPDLLSQQPAASQAHVQLEATPGLDPEAGPVEPGVAVGPLSPGPALPQSPAGMGHVPEVSEEAVVSDSTTTAALQSLISTLRQASGAVEEALPSSPVPPSSVATPNQPPQSFTSTSLGAIVPLGPVGSSVRPSGSNHALYGSSPTPRPGLPTSHVGPARHPADSTRKPATLGPGQGVSLARTTHRHPTDLPLVSGAGLLWAVVLQNSPAIATGESWSSQESPGPSEPFRMWSAQSSPGPTMFPLQGALSGPAHSLAETLAGPADSKKEAQKAPAIPTEQPGREGSTSEAAPCQTSQSATDVGTASEKVQPPVSQTPGRHEGARQAPSLTGSPTGFETALLSTEGVRLYPVHSAEDPEFVPSQEAALPTSAASASETAAAASNRLWWTLRQGSPLAGPRQWEWRRPPSAPMESSVAEMPVQAAATVGPLESGWHTWPPESGSASRSGPAIASTWLLAPVPEEETPTHPAAAVPDDARRRGRRVFVAENQLPLLKAAFLHVPCQLFLDTEFSGSLQNPHSAEYLGLVLSINETIAPLLASLPGFQRLEVKTIRPGSMVVAFEALFRAEASGLWTALNRSWLMERLPTGLRVANARVLRSVTLERPPDLCSLLFSCHAGYECVAGEDGDAVCTSLCHRDYCQNHGICTHEANHIPVCQCPVGSDFWFLGMRCNYKVTQQGLLGVACGLLLSLLVVGTAIASLVIRRVRLLLLEARADQSKSSYRRFCRLDDVSAHYWSEPWLASVSSLDNPAFSNSEELLHLQILDNNYCSCQDDCMAPNGSCKHLQDTPCISTAGRPSSHDNWDTSSNSVNDPMIDSGKASEVSVSSWPLEPIQWSPFLALHKLSGQQANKSQRPHSYCEGMELVNLERSWTA